MKKMNKKGFTLIELLTVIAILAVILLIAAPTILGVLDKAKKNTFKNQVLLAVEGLKTQIALNAMDQADMTLTLTDGKYTVDVTTIPMDSDTDLTGNIIATPQADGSYLYALSAVGDGTYCIATAADVTNIADSAIASSSTCTAGR